MSMFAFERYTNDEIIGKDDYGVPMGKVNDAQGHPASNMPKVTEKPLGLIPIGPNKDIGDE